MASLPKKNIYWRDIKSGDCVRKRSVGKRRSVYVVNEESVAFWAAGLVGGFIRGEYPVSELDDDSRLAIRTLDRRARQKCSRQKR